MDDCIFCKIAKKIVPADIVYEDDKTMVFMDANPKCDGHMLIIPKDHYPTVFDIDKDTLKHMYEVAEIMLDKMEKVSGKHGGTFSFNSGYMQEVMHAHMHVMPCFRKKAVQNSHEVYKKIMED